MTLFQRGDFTLHSGDPSDFKIECDVFTDEDIDTIAWMISERVPKFGFVLGVPRGGLRLADAMEPYRVLESNSRLIVDDVLTSGGSMEKFKRDMYPPIFRPVVFGAVVFARGPCPSWITPLWRLTP